MTVNSSDIIELLDKAAMQSSGMTVEFKRKLLAQAAAQIRNLYNVAGTNRSEMSYVPYFADDLEISAKLLENLPEQLTANLLSRAASLIGSLKKVRRPSSGIS